MFIFDVLKPTTMKLLLPILFLTSIVFGQDSELFGYVNTYRKANGVNTLRWDNDLYFAAKANTNKMLEGDTLLHSGNDIYECIIKEYTLVPTNDIKIGFETFLMRYFNMAYVDPASTKDTTDVIKYMLLYVVYSWHCSPAHRAIMLSDDATIGSVNINLGVINFKPNYKLVGGQKIEFTKFISHYEVKTFATLNLDVE